ncbi:MAG: cation-translocating P-type ATPase [Thermaerobacter sp.]|nr:cation-translocating P-type ATPase [Thermaerobacter sp.]
MSAERLQLKIGGMACSFCAASITKGLGRMPGVHGASVSLAHEEALIEYDSDLVTEERLRQTLLDLGYTIRDPRRVKAYEEQQKEIDLQKGRLILAAVFTGISLVEMALMWSGLVPKLVLQPVLAVTMPLLALLTIFVPGLYVLRMAWHSVRRGILNQHVLLEFGAFSGLLGGALGLVGQYGHIASLRFPAPDFFAVATFITTYHILSGYASLLVRTKASRSVMKLLELQPAMATVIRAGVEQEVSVEEVRVGERVRIRPGASIPLDGRVLQGASGVDESLVTGESLPVDKAAGAEVIGGSVNLTGSLIVEVTRVGDESFLQQVARQIEEARARKPGILQLVDRVLAVYVPGVLTAAALTILIWTLGAYLATGHVEIARGVFAMLAVFVMGYPCALGMATPLAMIRGGGMAAEHGILIRSGEAFEGLKDIRRVAFDKTGTLTEGRPSVTQVVPLRDATEQDTLRLAASAEAPSEHPLAQAIVRRADAERLDRLDVRDFEAIPGKGVRATLEGGRLLVGSPRLLREEGIDLRSLLPRVDALQDAGNTVVVAAEDGLPVGLIAIADTIKADAREAVARMRAQGVEPIMLTGDNERTARAVAQAVGISEFRAEVLPEEKAMEIRRLQAGGRRVMMVGDGINDGPALTQADVGVAIGAGTDIAIESADVVLMGERLAAVADAMEIGRSSYRKTVQNITLAFAFNGVGIPLAMTGLVAPIWAMLAMVVSVSTVLANSFLGMRWVDTLQH